MLVMKKGMLTLALFFASTFLVSNCSSDDGTMPISCGSCPSTQPYRYWDIELGDFCFKTQAECEEWVEANRGIKIECQKCYDPLH